MITSGLDDRVLRQAAAPSSGLAAPQQDPVVGVRKLFQPRALPGTYHAWPDEDKTWLLRNLLPELARTYDVQFISDAYWTHAAVVEASALAAQPVSLAALLDGPRTEYTHDWDRRDRLIRLRSRTWFLDRPRDVPLRVVQRCRDLIRTRGALPVEEYLSLATTLTDGQLSAFDDVAYQNSPLNDLDDLYGARHALRLYASLTAAQRRALSGGALVPAVSLTLPQRQLFRAALQEEGAASMHQEPSPDWTFALSHERIVRIIREQEGSSAITDEPETPHPDAGGSPATAAAPSRQTAMRFLVTRMEFHFHYGRDEEKGFPLTFAPPRDQAVGQRR
jgi:hypothetical protein